MTGLLGREKEYFPALLWRLSVVEPVIFSLLRRTSFFAPFLFLFVAASFSRVKSMSSRDLYKTPNWLSLTLRWRRSFKNANFLRIKLELLGLFFASSSLFISASLSAEVFSVAGSLSRRKEGTVLTTALRRPPLRGQSLSSYVSSFSARENELD